MAIRQIINLKRQGTSNREIAEMLSIGRNTVNRRVAELASLASFEELEGMDDASLMALLTAKSEKSNNRYEQLAEQFSYFFKELKRPGCTLETLWLEYKKQYPDGYQYTQFVHHYRQWTVQIKVSSKLDHKAGEKTYFDFTGKKLHYIDQTSGEIKPAEVFVAILPCSQYIYCEAFDTQQTHDIIDGIIHTVEFYGGTTKAWVPDNMSAIVSKADRLAPRLTKTFTDFSLHYNVVIDPTRPDSPQDKALVENAVNLVYQQIFYPIRNMSFFSLRELNEEGIFPRLEKLNDRMFSQVNYSRKELFFAIEKPHLRPLPPTRYQIKTFRQGKVQKMGCVFLYDDQHYYGVPYRYVGEYVELRYDSQIVEIYYEHKRLWTYKRDRRPGKYTIAPELRTKEEEKYKVWDHDEFKRKAGRIGPYTAQYVSKLILQYEYVDMGCKQAMAILQLPKHYDVERIEKACRLGLQASWYTYHTLKNILAHGMEQLELDWDQQQSPIPEHENIRGSDYYK